MTFFDSRWVDMPEHVKMAPAGALAGGFRAHGVAAGLKPSGGLDVGLLVSSAPETTSAARFTASGVLAPPVVVCQKRCDLEHLRAVAVNSGNANAATGGRGIDAAAKMQGAGAMCAGVAENQVAIASTGVIGVQLDADKVVKGLLQARGGLSEHYGSFGEAIRTTVAFP
ncbi:MAG: glutamate N-acetyltransferase / amino-acid N-acetyltransferase [Solirubrobacteraceae bacterium]|nr:glutamate N-acetyltransferase / amino-acid N-acetyltransferase [Solirubrobacteraceae bacterium]